MVSHEVGAVNWRLSETGAFTRMLFGRVVVKMARQASLIVEADD